MGMNSTKYIHTKFSKTNAKVNGRKKISYLDLIHAIFDMEITYKTKGRVTYAHKLWSEDYKKLINCLNSQLFSFTLNEKRTEKEKCKTMYAKSNKKKQINKDDVDGNSNLRSKHGALSALGTLAIPTLHLLQLGWKAGSFTFVFVLTWKWSSVHSLSTYGRPHFTQVNIIHSMYR